MGMSPYKMVYEKACHLLLELEHKAYWAVRELNEDRKLAGKKRLLDMFTLQIAREIYGKTGAPSDGQSWVMRILHSFTPWQLFDIGKIILLNSPCQMGGKCLITVRKQQFYF
jgi:hypothetical protein